MELTRTDAVFSRIAMVLFMCRKSSRNDLKINGDYFWKILKILAKESRPGGPPPIHEGGGHAPCLVGPLLLHRPQLQLHIFVFGEKKTREKDSSRFPSPEPKTDSRSAIPRKNRAWWQLHIVKLDESFSLIFFSTNTNIWSWS